MRVNGGEGTIGQPNLGGVGEHGGALGGKGDVTKRIGHVVAFSGEVVQVVLVWQAPALRRGHGFQGAVVRGTLEDSPPNALPRSGSRMNGLVHSDVVWVAIAAVGAVGQHRMGLKRYEMLLEQGCRFIDSVDQRTRVVVRWRAGHAGIAEVSETTQLNAADPQGVEGTLQLPSTKATKAVTFRQSLVRRTDDFAFLPQRCGDHGDLSAAGGHIREGSAGEEHLIIGVCMHGHDAVAGEIFSHHLSSTVGH